MKRQAHITGQSAGKRAGKRGRRNARGYTAIEVLMAMTLLGIGGAGVISMQKVTIQGGEDARRFDMATNIANEWLSRLQRDSSFWTLPSSENQTVINLFTNTKWLSQITACAGVFCNPPVPASSPDGVSPAFDMWGRDLASGSTEARYCVQYRLTWIADPGTAPNLRPTSLMRAEVRVYWNRLEAFPLGNCAGTPPPEVLPAASPFHMVSAATTVRPWARR